MVEKNTDFDKAVDRYNTDCLKFDFAKKRGKPEDVLSYWVADMDFQTSSIVLDKMTERISHGIFGYTETGERYFNAVAGWLKKHHDLDVKEEWLVKTPGVMFALAMVIKALTEPGDRILIQEPLYYPFKQVVEDNGRVVVSSDLYLKNGRYYIDYEDFEKKVVNNHIRMFLLCNPHNPVGRVWSREELERLGDICLANDVIVVSDEIHSDLIVGDVKHTPFLSIKKEYEDISITCTSPAKTFNLAGLQISNIFIPNRTIRHGFERQRDAAGYSQLNTMGIVACEAAYLYGEEWYEAVMTYIKSNLNFLRDYLKENISSVRLIEPEGTYLVWLDMRELNLNEDELEDLIVNKAGLWLDRGAIFGRAGEGFERINIATSREYLKQGLDSLKEAIENYTGICNYVI